VAKNHAYNSAATEIDIIIKACATYQEKRIENKRDI
jgi:hypothetical protein